MLLSKLNYLKKFINLLYKLNKLILKEYNKEFIIRENSKR